MAWLEQSIDGWEAELEPLKTFILPGGSPAAAASALGTDGQSPGGASWWSRLPPSEPIRGEVIRYVNRLSDALFVAARAANQLAGVPDVPGSSRVEPDRMFTNPVSQGVLRWRTNISLAPTWKARECRSNARAAGRSCLTGCLIVFVILVGDRDTDWLLDFAELARTGRRRLRPEGIRQGVEASQLPAAEKQEIMVQVERVATAFRENADFEEQLGNLVQKLVQSP